ncbi:MAG: HipA domain-containing protein [Proteobacteria bacterium]|nr:HipA domain-containing protein [Pseudomonadota bacterium]
MARAAGLKIAESKAIKLGSKHHIFLTRRFDRDPIGRRGAYASAMTLLGKKDGESEGSSYKGAGHVRAWSAVFFQM